jgi:phage baseplate assembly protein W
MGYKVNEQSIGTIALNESDATASVLQNVAVILATRKGSVPLYRDFGLSMSFMDRPVEAAKPLIVADIEDALRTYEPRATLIGVTFETDKSTPGRLIPTVEVEIDNEYDE